MKLRDKKLPYSFVLASIPVKITSNYTKIINLEVL